MIYYHARLEFHPERSSFWWNMTKENMVRYLLIPFVNGQVVDTYARGKKILLNMKTVSHLRIYETDYALLPPKAGDAPSEMLEAAFEDKDCTAALIDEVRQMQANPTLSSLQKAFIAPKQQLFVIMKFGDALLDLALDEAIRPVAREFSLKVVRVDKIQDAGKITDEALEGIATSRYVLADLSGERPNCYYEAGFAHALGKETILTIRKGDPVHFNLAGYRFIRWETATELRRALRSRLRALVKHEESQVGP